MKAITLIAIFLLIQNETTNSVTKNITISPATSEITIDGSAEESAWASVPFIYMDQNKGDAANKNNIAKFKMTYDTKYVYYYVEITDNKIDTFWSWNEWERDCVEIYFGMDTTSRYDPNTNNNGYSRARKVVGREISKFSSNGYIVNEQTIVNGYSQEWKISWDSLTVSLLNWPKYCKSLFRFQCFNSDNDGAGRNSQLYSNEFIDNCVYGTYTGKWNLIHLAYPLSTNSDEINKLISIKNGIIEFPETMNYSYLLTMEL